MNQNLQTPVPCRALSSAGLTRNGHPNQSDSEKAKKHRVGNLKYSQSEKRRLRDSLPKNKARKLVQEASYRNKPENKEKQRLYMAAYYEKHRDKLIAANKARAATARVKEMRREAYAARVFTQEEREAMRERGRAWRATARGISKKSSDNAKRRALLIGATIGDLKAISDWETKWRGKKRVVCYWCGGRTRAKSAHADHIIALSKGGTHRIENLCVSCADCNLRKGAKSINEWNGLLNQPSLLHH